MYVRMFVCACACALYHQVEPSEKIPRWERIQGTHTELMKELFNARVK